MSSQKKTRTLHGNRTNLLEQAIACDDGDQAAKIIQNALGIESDDVINYTFPKTWPADRERRSHHRRVAAGRGAVRSITPAAPIYRAGKFLLGRRTGRAIGASESEISERAGYQLEAEKVDWGR